MLTFRVSGFGEWTACYWHHLSEQWCACKKRERLFYICDWSFMERFIQPWCSDLHHCRTCICSQCNAWDGNLNMLFNVCVIFALWVTHHWLEFILLKFWHLMLHQNNVKINTLWEWMGRIESCSRWPPSGRPCILPHSTLAATLTDFRFADCVAISTGKGTTSSCLRRDFKIKICRRLHEVSSLTRIPVWRSRALWLACVPRILR